VAVIRAPSNLTSGLSMRHRLQRSANGDPRLRTNPSKGDIVDSDRIEGKAKEVEGQVTGDESREAEGKAQGAWGETKDKADDAWEGVKDKVGDVVDGDDDDKTSEADRP